ncbi:MAG: hypothetical protein ACUZ8O_15990 [Candidatus Anammoxibacter sp.]
MIKKVIKITDLNDKNSTQSDLKYWLKKSPEERVATVDYLRRQYHGSPGRLQRVAKVIQRSFQEFRGRKYLKKELRVCTVMYL